ncbi:MAG: sulfatase-like hydrolase/transferase [bacterium]|nr:sulfatase-like hydrolase/transferase [bacterium]
MNKSPVGIEKIFLSLCLLLFLFPSSSLSTPQNKKSPPNLMVITVDTLRADRLGCYGYKRIKTPQIDALASEGVLFEWAFTPTPTTLPAHASIFTGTYPITHGLRSNGTFALSEAALTLAELLKQQGYETAAFVSAYVLDSRFGLDQGFNIYNDDLTSGVSAAMLQKERRAETVTRAAVQWLGSRKKEVPFFLWVHYYDPHTAYDPPQPFKDVYAHSPYDGEIAYTDSWIKVLINKLKEQGIYDQTLIVLSGDHGEALGDHGEDTHGIFLYEATLHVPLIFRYPPRVLKNTRISSLVRLIDIAPTLLDILGQKAPQGMQGVSLLPLLSGQKKDLNLVLYCETDYPRFTYGWSPLEGLRTAQWKYIRAPESELYNLANDPAEAKNLIQKEKKLAEQYEKEFLALKKQLAAASGQQTAAKPLTLDAASREKLRSLGYVFTSDPAKNKSSTYPDPKRKIGLLKYFNQGANYLSQQKYAEAIKEFEKVIKEDPQNIDAFTCLGAVYQAMGKSDKAIESYRQAVALGPDHLDNLVQLATLSLSAGQAEEAKSALERALRLNPKSREVYLNLGIYYIGKGNWTEAKANLEKCLELDPGYSLAQNHLVSVYYNLKEVDKAISLCQTVLKANPKDPSALYNLASIYLEERKASEAADYFRKLIEISPNYSRAYHGLGMAYAFQNSFDQAIDSFQKAAAKDPKWADPHLNLGIIYAQNKGDFPKALEEFKKVLAIDPQNALGRQLLERTEKTIEMQRSGSMGR